MTTAGRDAPRGRLARIAAEMEAVAAELDRLDPRSRAPVLLRRWRTEIALAVGELPPEEDPDGER